jgi:hypothetical protein
MSGNSFGRLFCVTSFGESHGPAIGCVVDGCPPGLDLSEADLQGDLDRRRPGKTRHTTQRREPDQVRILSGVFEGRTLGTPILLLIENVDQKPKDYSNIKDVFRPALPAEIRVSRLSRGRTLFGAGNRRAGCGGRHRQKIPPRAGGHRGARLRSAARADQGGRLRLERGR